MNVLKCLRERGLFIDIKEVHNRINLRRESCRVQVDSEKKLKASRNKIFGNVQAKGQPTNFQVKCTKASKTLT